MRTVPSIALALGLIGMRTGLLVLADDSDTRPNIILILADDLGFSDLGCYGSEIETPHLDGLAEEGLRFTDFYNCGRCWPTRATLMSGTYTSSLERGSMVTIPEVLSQTGYQTGMVGKWHLGTDPDKTGPHARGFERYYGTLGGAGSYWEPPLLARDDTIIPTPERAAGYYYTREIGQEAARQIDAFASNSTPFFQYIAFTAPHWPLHAPEETVEKYRGRYDNGWTALRSERYHRMIEMGLIDPDRWPLPDPEPSVGTWEAAENKRWRARNMEVYAAMVDEMDQAIGALLESLRRNGLWENTFIVFMGDNGACPEHLSGNGWNTATNVLERREATGGTLSVGDDPSVPAGGPDSYTSVGHEWANAQNTPLRRYKANTHEGGVGAPCIVHWPAGIDRPGTITGAVGHVVDLMATCVDLAQTRYPGEDPGVILPTWGTSLLAICRGDTLPERPLYFNHGGSRALRQGPWKIVADPKGDWELYNLDANKTETINLADVDPERVRTMASDWNYWLLQTQGRLK